MTAGTMTATKSAMYDALASSEEGRRMIDAKRQADAKERTKLLRELAGLRKTYEGETADVNSRFAEAEAALESAKTAAATAHDAYQQALNAKSTKGKGTKRRIDEVEAAIEKLADPRIVGFLDQLNRFKSTINYNRTHGRPSNAKLGFDDFERTVLIHTADHVAALGRISQASAKAIELRTAADPTVPVELARLIDLVEGRAK